MDLIGRKFEIRELQRLCSSGRPELVVVYGRRRVGKTFLVKEYFGGDFAFYFTGTVGVANAVHLGAFDEAIAERGGARTPASANWHDAFRKLRMLLSSRLGAGQSPGAGQPGASRPGAGQPGAGQSPSAGRLVVFMDEMPWLDAPGSDFLEAFDYFWNSWASSVPEMLFIVCGSSTSWITKKLFRNRKGLHNRVTGRVYLAPFSLGECAELFKSRGIETTRYQTVESYMVFGGIPFYLDMFDKGLSPSQNVDRLCFGPAAPLKEEYRELYHSLFSSPQRHMQIVEALSRAPKGMMRSEIAEASGIPANGHFSEALVELEQCDFIERYADFARRKNGAHYFLKDPFTLFYLRYMRGNDTKDEYFWTNYSEDGGHRAWSGHAFELVCRSHLRQMKSALGISGMSTSASAWRSKGAKPGAQIDLLIDRRDGVINLCEMKFLRHPYTIGKPEAEALERKKCAFAAETKTKSALHFTMVTTYGVEQKGYASMIQSQITMGDLFT